MNPYKAAYVALIVVLAVIAVLCFGLGQRLTAADQAAASARDRRLINIICAHVVADEAYMASIQAYNRLRIQRDPKLAGPLRPLTTAISVKRDAVVQLDHADCR